MKYCPNCGKPVDPKAVICPHCGVPLPKRSIINTNDTGSIWWGMLGFLIPIVGLILFIYWKNTEPDNARVAGIGALLSVIGAAIINFLYAI